MSTNLQLEGETTQKYSLPLSHLDYSYIEKCTNAKELEKIVRVLRSGEEGKFPDLENYAEKRLEKLNPKSRALRKDGPILRPGDLSSGDWKNIEEDLKNWTNSMHEKDSHPTPVKQGVRSNDDIVEGDENLPPVRSTNVILEGKKQKMPEEKKKKKRVMPRDYKEWDKVDVDAELQKLDNEEENKKQTTEKSSLKTVSVDIDTTGLSEEEKELKANREKDKGNEAFRSHDYEESVTYYTRSISLMPSSASYNNRALAYLKLEKWDKAIKDCNSVLKIEAENIKALLRRGTALKGKKDFEKAEVDFEKVLKMEPNNKKAEDLLGEVKKELKKQEKERQEKGGRRMVIEEVESDEETDEEIEVEKPVVNGYGPHDSEREQESPSVASESSKQAADSSVAPTSHVEISSMSLSSNSKSSQDSQAKPAQQKSAQEPPSPEDVECKKSQPSKESSSRGPTSSQEDTTRVCSNSSAGAPPPTVGDSTPSPPENSSASSTPQLEPSVPGQPSKQKPSDASTPTVSFTLEESSQAAPQSTSNPGDLNSPSSLTRPMFVQMPLPQPMLAKKEEGNKLFRSGQYGEAIEQYSKAIVQLEKEKDQYVNLSVLLSNRAACHLKTGNCSQAVADCHLSLKHVPHSVKALLRRAAAYEALEKYAEAYIDYKHVISIDKSADQAHQGASRCQGTLQQTFGLRTWRDKIPPLVHVQPWEVPLIVDQEGMHKSLSSSVSLAEQGKDPQVSPASAPQMCSSEKSSQETAEKNSVTSSTGQSQSNSSILPQAAPPSAEQEKKAQPSSSHPPPKASSQSTNAASQRTPEQEFEEVKGKGNQHVQKGQYQEALECYTTCISLCPNQVACYTNRALCYLKLNMAAEAEADCDKALSLQSNNPKALYRRALARKMCQHYKLSLQDLVELLKLEPKNSAAQKEMDIVKKSYKEELEMLKKKAAAEQESKVRKRMKIEEVDDDEEEEKPVRGKAADKSKSQSKSRGGKMSQPSPGSKSKPSSADKKPSQAHEASIQGQPVAPPIAPRLMKTTPYEFCQAWNSLKPCQGIQPYAEILRQVSPVDLPTVISNKLDGQMLQIIVRCVYEEMVLKGEVDLGYQILHNLCQVPRFSTVAMFMTGKEKKEVSAVLDILSKTTSSAYASADIVRLKKEYSVK